jgi:hypothetical protein
MVEPLQVAEAWAGGVAPIAELIGRLQCGLIPIAFDERLDV